MGRNPRLKASPSRASDHAEGTTVVPIHLAVHQQLGTIGCQAFRLWTVHYEHSFDSFEQLTALHQRLVEFPVNERAAVRLISDVGYLKDIYRCGTTMVSEAVRTIQHFCEEIERTTGHPPVGSTVNERLRNAAASAGLELDLSSPGYAALTELQSQRDAIEHPTEERVYASSPEHWDRVPLSWFLSERSLRCFERYEQWFSGLATAWEAISPSFARAGELQVERGIGSDLQYSTRSRQEHRGRSAGQGTGAYDIRLSPLPRLPHAYADYQQCPADRGVSDAEAFTDPGQ